MFTGIIEEVGRVVSVKRGRASSVLTIAGTTIFDDIHLGDSIAVDGVCLTVSTLNTASFSADVMHETLERSTLGALTQNSNVNLERAMPADGRFGGHIVSGHIDGRGTITSLRRDDNALWYTVRADQDILRYIVLKGSIAIDGISLTVAALTEHDFSVSVIPHTAQATTLSQKRAGDLVNLENDLIGKYVERLLAFESSVGAGAAQKNSTLTREFLLKHGF